MTGTPGSSFRQATRPRYDVPRSVASARTREAQPEVAFDTDLIGPAGCPAAVPRTYLLDGTGPTARHLRSYADAEAFLAEVIGESTPRAALDEVGERRSSRLPRAHHPQRCPFTAYAAG